MKNYLLSLVYISFSAILYGQNTINADLDFHNAKDISPLIYGYNQDHETIDGNNNWTARRLGGNRMSVFNWENGASNAGHDNATYPNDNRIPSLVGVLWNDKDNAGEAYRLFHQDNIDAGVESIITLPILGYVAADKDGGNKTNPPSARWDELILKKGTALSLTPDLDDGKVYLDESFNYLIQTFGNSTTENGVKYIALDNEPALWDNTHDYVQTSPPTISEYIGKLIESAKVIKSMDPNVKIIAGEFAGINIYDFSNATDWSTLGKGYDWFPSLLLDSLKRASDDFGTPLVDIISFHFYPQHKIDASGNFSSGGTIARTSSSTAEHIREARMDFTRSLWDSTYTEPSWLTNSKLGGDPNMILHRLQKSIDEYFPSVEVMIGEFDYGHDADISHGLSMADFLGAAAQYDVSITNRWDLDAYNGSTYTNSAYQLFRNYDGSNQGFGSTAIHSNFDAREDGSVWASLNEDGSELHLIVINKDVNETLNYTINSGETDYEYAVKEVYGFNSTGKTISTINNAEVTINEATFSGSLNALSAYHIVINRNKVVTGCDLTVDGIGGFDNNEYDEWNYFTSAGAGELGTFSQETNTTHTASGSLKIDVQTDHNWGVRMFQKCDYGLTKDYTYTTNFWVYGGKGKQVKVALQHHDVGTTVIAEHTVDLTSDGWQEYSVSIPSDGDYTKGKIKFTFPHTGNYYLDDVVITGEKPSVLKPIKPNDPQLRYTGVVYNNVTDESATFYRFPLDYATNNQNLSNPFVQATTAKRAAASSGISIEFKTNSKNIVARFRENTTITGGIFTLDFAVYKNGELYNVFTDTDDNIELSLQDNSGESNTWRITMPSFAQIEFLGLDIDETTSLEVLPPDNKPIYIAIGNSITHGMGQTNLSTHLTYPWLVADSLNYHLYNWGVGGSKVHESVFDNIAQTGFTPDVVSVLWGYNDFNCAHVNCNTDDYIINKTLVYYKNLMTNLASNYPNATIVGILPTYSNTAQKSSVRSLDYLRTEQATIVTTLQNTYDNITFFNGNDVTDANSLSDDVHLNDLGAEQVAYRLIKTIKELNAPERVITDTLVLRSEYEKVGELILDLNNEKEGEENYQINTGNDNSYYVIDPSTGELTIAKTINDQVETVHTDLLEIQVGTNMYNVKIVDSYDYFIYEHPEFTVLEEHQAVIKEEGNAYTPYNNIWGKGSAVNGQDFRMATLVHAGNPDSTIFIWDTPSKASEFGGSSVWCYVNMLWGERHGVRENLGDFPIRIGDISTFTMDFEYEQLFGTEKYKVALNHFLNEEDYVAPFTENDGDLFMVFDQVGNYIPSYNDILKDTIIGGQDYVLMHDSTGTIQNNTPEGYQLRRAIIKNDGQFKEGTLDIKALYNSFSSRGYLDENLHFSHIQMGIEVTEGWGAVRFNKFKMNLNETIPNEKPTVELEASSTEVKTGEFVTLTWTASDIDGEIVSTIITLDNEEQNWESGDQWLATEGIHLVKITVTDSEGATTSDEVTITVTNPDNKKPTVELTASSYLADIGDMITFEWSALDEDGEIVESIITLNGIEQDWTNGYEWVGVEGEHSITVTVKDNKGAEASDQIDVSVIQHLGLPPQLNIQVNSNSPKVGDVLTFTWKFENPDDEIVSSLVTLNGVEQSWINGQEWVSVAGEHKIEVIVTDQRGNDYSEEITITVIDPENELPTVELTSSVDDVTDTYEGDIITFNWTANDIDGEIISTIITLDDVEQNWENGHQWTAVEGTHTIKITVTDDKGAITTNKIIIEVHRIHVPLPIVELEASATKVDEGEIITFNWTIHSDDIESTVITLDNIEQNWDDGHQWVAVEGTHTVKVIFTDGSGYSDYDEITITVNKLDETPVTTDLLNITNDDELELGSTEIDISVANSDEVKTVTLIIEDNDGNIEKVEAELNNDGTFTANWENDIEGEFTLSTEIEENNGAITTSEKTSITIKEDTMKSLIASKTTQHLMYPNPTSNVLYFTTVSENTTYELFNTQGTKLEEGNYLENGISMKKHPSGVYLIKIDGKIYKVILR